MADGNTSIFLDVILLISLIISIGYMFLLTRGLKKIHESRNEFSQVLKELNQTIGRAEMAVDGMKNTAEVAGKKLQKEIDTASGLRDELQFINQAGDNVARRLEKLTTSDEKSAPSKKPPTNPKMSRSEKELADAMAKHEQQGKG